MKPDTRERLYRLWWLAVLAGHGLAALVWLWMMPGGFPIDHPRFWANRAAPAAMLALVIAGFIARARGRSAAFASIVLAIGCLWFGLAIGLAYTFQICGWRPGIMALVVGAMLTFGWLRSLRSIAPARYALAGALLAGIVGAIVPRTQRAGPPSTHPLNVELTRGAARARDVDDARAARLRSDLMVQPADGVVTMQLGPVDLTLQPLLTFVSRSPDRFWSNMNPHRGRWFGLPHELSNRWWIKDGVAFNYVDPSTGESSLHVVAPADDPRLTTIEAISRLDEPVYSHLNTFTELGIYGHRSLAVSFSPCPDLRVDVMPSDYPIGRPARCAYLAADGTFHVVEASSGEKGPFTSLAVGKLARGEPLTITMYDDGDPLCHITLDDFSAQAGTGLSPTAGWGLPGNAIEFSRFGDATSSPVGISITLAGTSMGRGWDSVGHAEGTYRNRMRIERLKHSTTRESR